MGGSKQRLRLTLGFEVDHRVILAIEKTPLLKMSSGRKRCLKFSKRRKGSFGGRCTKRYLRMFEKFDKTSKKQVELGTTKEISSTDESTDDTDLEEAQPDLTTGVLCVITTDELDFRSTLDNEAGASLECSEVINGRTSVRVEDRYADPQLNTGVEGTEEFQSINEGHIRQSNVWMVERDYDDQWLRMAVTYKCVSEGQGPRKECYSISVGSSNDFGSRSEEVHGMPIVWYPPVDSRGYVVYSRRGESQSVIELLFSLMSDVHSRREEFCQRRFCFNSCRDLMSRGTIWLQTSRKERWSRLKLMMRWCWRRRPPDVRWRSSEEMRGQPFKHGRKKDLRETSLGS